MLTRLRSSEESREDTLRKRKHDRGTKRPSTMHIKLTHLIRSNSFRREEGSLCAVYIAGGPACHRQIRSPANQNRRNGMNASEGGH